MANYLAIRLSPTANATPMRNFDWCAYVDGCEEDGKLYGYGATEQEALDALGEVILERVDDAIYDLEHAGAISKEDALEAFVSIDGIAYVPY